jgi:SET domain-containing protein
MAKLVKVYTKKDTDLFLMDLLKELNGQDNFYKINEITVEITEKEAKYIIDIVFLDKKNVNKNYMPAKKTGDDEKQVTTKDKEVL